MYMENERGKRFEKNRLKKMFVHRSIEKGDNL